MAGSEALGRLLRHSGDYGALNLGGVRLHAVGMCKRGGVIWDVHGSLKWDFIGIIGI